MIRILFLFLMCCLHYGGYAQGITLGTSIKSEDFTSFVNTKIFVLDGYRDLDHMAQVVNEGPELNSYNLWVERGIMTAWLKYAGVDSWADHVFDKSYPLPKLHEIRDFISAEKHLPGIPSAQEMKSNGGQSMKEMDRLLLTKIEELYLYQIQEEKKMTQIQEEEVDDGQTRLLLSELQAKLAEVLIDHHKSKKSRN